MNLQTWNEAMLWGLFWGIVYYKMPWFAVWLRELVRDWTDKW